MYLFHRLLLLLFPALFTLADSLPYDVHWLGGGAIIERDVPAPKQAVDIYCYPGTSKNLFALWQTVKFHIRIRNNEFRQYFGTTPEEVYKEYIEDSYGWSVVNPFLKKAQKTTSLSLFTPTCMAINTKQRHSIELQIIRVDIWRIILMFLGISLIMASRALSGNPVFFYLCGIFVGVSASFMVLVYYISKLLPGRKTLTYGILIGGWTVGVYVFQQIWENIRTILLTYQTHMFWYVLVVSFVSFLVCYRIGPPRNQRSKNLVMWTLQAVGVLMVFFSSDYQDAAGAVIITSLVIKYFPQSLLHRIEGYWRRRFPPKPRLLTNEEYYEEGARETKKALENLRKYCSSPDCAQWNIMLKLNDSRRSGTSPARRESKLTPRAQRVLDSSSRPAREELDLTPSAHRDSDSTPRSARGESDLTPSVHRASCSTLRWSRRESNTTPRSRGESDLTPRAKRESHSTSRRARRESNTTPCSHRGDSELTSQAQRESHSTLRWIKMESDSESDSSPSPAREESDLTPRAQRELDSTSRWARRESDATSTVRGRSDSSPRPVREESDLTPRAHRESDSTPTARSRSDSSPRWTRGNSDSIRRLARGRTNSSRGRFASFVEGNSHLSDEEILDYESYAFSMDRCRKPSHLANCTRTGHDISDDDSSEYEEL